MLGAKVLIHPSTDDQVLIKLEENQKILQELRHGQSVMREQNAQMFELLNYNFTRQWNLEMKKIEAECPNTFVLLPSKGKPFNPKNWVSHEYRLHLMCQHPPGPHKVEGEGYSLRQAEAWWVTVSPWLNYLIKFLKFGVPMGKAIGAVVDEVDVKQMQTYIDLLDEITKELPEFADLASLKRLDKHPHPDQEQATVGPALRALYSFLKEADPSQIWGGLSKTLTPDGNILWLCGEHRKVYEVKPLQLKV